MHARQSDARLVRVRAVLAWLVSIWNEVDSYRFIHRDGRSFAGPAFLSVRVVCVGLTHHPSSSFCVLVVVVVVVLHPYE